MVITRLSSARGVSFIASLALLVSVVGCNEESNSRPVSTTGSAVSGSTSTERVVYERGTPAGGLDPATVGPEIDVTSPAPGAHLTSPDITLQGQALGEQEESHRPRLNLSFAALTTPQSGRPRGLARVRRQVRRAGAPVLPSKGHPAC